MGETSTIAAVSTPSGVGAVGMVRLSGPEALAVAGRVFAPAAGRGLEALGGYRGALGRIVDRRGEAIDDAVAFVYRAPRSYTGEDVVELCCHGGRFAVGRALRLCLDAGAQPAAPGEFTKRAFVNGKLALTEAEAVADLIGAQSDAAMRAALSARDGALSRAVEALTGTLLAASAHIAAWSDYPEEDLIPVDPAALAAELLAVRGGLEELLATYDRGRILREGAATVILGKPNVGKSTLMNLLSGSERSIVTDIPGTTRDLVEDTVRLGDCVLRLLDTAGLRETGDEVERIGVERALAQIETAELILAVFDSSDPLGEEDRALIERLRGKRCIAVVNKIDLPRRLPLEELAAALGEPVVISAKTGEGRQALERRISALLGLDTLDAHAAMVANERQRRCLEEARAALDEALGALGDGMTLDAVAVCIDGALDQLLSLSGQRVTDAVVDEVFARFCVGK